MDLLNRNALESCTHEVGIIITRKKQRPIVIQQSALRQAAMNPLMFAMSATALINNPNSKAESTSPVTFLHLFLAASAIASYLVSYKPM